MKRINIYIDDDTDTDVDYLSEMFNINRSELIRRAITNYVVNYKETIDNFIDGISETTPTKNQKLINRYKSDIVDFSQSELFWNTIDNGVSRVKLYDYQKLLLNDFNEYNKIVIRKSRQIGITRLFEIHALHTAIFSENKSIIIATHKLYNSKEMLNNIYKMLELLPDNIKPSLVSKNNTTLSLSNGCKITASLISADSLRGHTIDQIYVDECAFAKREVFDFFMQCVNTQPNSKVIIASTPNGHNHFHKLFVDAVCQYNNYRHITLKYDVIPKHRSISWKNQQIALIGQKRFDSEYECVFVDINDENRTYGFAGDSEYAV